MHTLQGGEEKSWSPGQLGIEGWLCARNTAAAPSYVAGPPLTIFHMKTDGNDSGPISVFEIERKENKVSIILLQEQSFCC